MDVIHIKNCVRLKGTKVKIASSLRREREKKKKERIEL